MLQGPVNSASKAADAQFERYGDEFVAVEEKTSKSLIFSWIIMSSEAAPFDSGYLTNNDLE
jgi:hypothetical protein